MIKLSQISLRLTIRITIGVYLILLQSCKEEQKPSTIENVLELEQIHIDSILSQYPVLEHTKQFHFKASEFVHPDFDYYDVILNPFLYEKENKDYTSAPGLNYPYPNKSICYSPPVLFKDSIYIEYDVLQNMFYLKDFRTKKKVVLEERFEVSYAVKEFSLYYPKLIIFSVSEIYIYDLETHKKLRVNAFKQQPNVYFDFPNHERHSLYDSTKSFGWSSKYYKKDDTSCFIADFKELVTKRYFSYILSINPRTGRTIVYDSMYYRHADTSDWSHIPIDIRHYSKAIGLIYSLGDSAYRIKNIGHRPFKKVKLRIPNLDIESVNSNYTITKGSNSFDSTKFHLDFQIFETNDFRLMKRINEKIKIISPEIITDGFVDHKMFFDKYLFIPYSINYAQDGKRDYLVYDIPQNKLKRLLGISSWIDAFEDDKCNYLYIPNKGVFLAKRFN